MSDTASRPRFGTHLDFASIVEGLIEGVLVNDPEGSVVFVNPALAMMLGYRPGEMVGRTIFDFMDAEAQAISRRKLAERRRGAADRFDFRFQHRDGSTVWTRVSARPLYSATGDHQGSLVNITDISTHVALKRELEAARIGLEHQVAERTEELAATVTALEHEVVVRGEAERRAVAANQAKTGFLANMSHELRTPLNAIIGYTEMMQEMVDEPISSCRDDLARVRASSVHLLALIDDVLDLSRIEAGALRLEPSELDVTLALHDLAQGLRPDMAKRSNMLEVDLGELPTAYRTDARRFRQVILNLLSNANKFTTGSTIVLRAHLHDGNGVRVTVTDDGPGIPIDLHESIFQPFQRGDDRLNRAVGGTGLGLAISRRFARRLGGDLTVDSLPGQGATFTFITTPIS